MRAKYAVPLAFLSCFSAAICLSQERINLRADRIEATVQQSLVDAEDKDDLHVTIRVTIHAGEQALIIPICPEENTEGKRFCVAHLVRADGRGIGVRNGLAASLGVEGQDKWKPVIVAPKTQETFSFGFDTRLLDVQPNEPLRVKFEAWSDAQSIQDWKSATMLLSPRFQCPSKPS